MARTKKAVDKDPSYRGKTSNLPAKKYKSGNRTSRTLRYKINGGSGLNRHFIDLSAGLSAQNNRSYRQGCYYYVSKVTVHNTGDMWCKLATAPDTWMTKQAWIRAYRKYCQMVAEAVGTDGTILPKYHDFKVSLLSFANTHFDANGAYVGELPSQGFDVSNAHTDYKATPDEWQQSRFSSQDPRIPGVADDQFFAHLVGPHSGSPGSWDSIGLIRSYIDTRRHHDDDTPVLDGDMDTDALANLFDASDQLDNIRLDLDNHNDETPYDANAGFGDGAYQLQMVGQLATGDGSGVIGMANGFVVPFGLLAIETGNADDSASPGEFEIVIEMMPGPYNGVYAERIFDDQ